MMVDALSAGAVGRLLAGFDVRGPVHVDGAAGCVTAHHRWDGWCDVVLRARAAGAGDQLLGPVMADPEGWGGAWSPGGAIVMPVRA